MKAIYHFQLFIVFSAFLLGCSKKNLNPDIDQFCSAVPDGWACEIIQDNFNPIDIPQGADNPDVIIKFINPEREFTYSVGEKQLNPSLILNFYSIKHKAELIDFIKSQQVYSWCIPMYYGETKDYFIITSPCFINGGAFTDEANSCIDDLHTALKNIIVVNNYEFI